MSRNLHTYRNLGVPVNQLRCSHCGERSIFSICLDTDSKRQKMYSLGCNECGVGFSIGETTYEELYELSFEFDRFQEGKISREAFEQTVPDRCRLVFEKVQADKERPPQDAAKANPAKESSQPDPDPTKSWPKPDMDANRDTSVVLANSTLDTLGAGIVLAALSGLGLSLYGLAVGFPDWMAGGVVLAVFLWSLGVGFAVGTFLSYKRFPKSLAISGSAIVIEPRGKSKTLRYKLRDVSRVNYGQGAKFLTVWLQDGNTFVVRASKEKSKELDRFFSKTK